MATAAVRRDEGYSQGPDGECRPGPECRPVQVPLPGIPLVFYSHPPQVLCLAEEIRFSTDVEAALSAGGGSKLDGVLNSQNDQLKAFTESHVEDFVLSLKLKALVLDLIHRVDVVEQLIKEKAANANCWTWQRQLRFYLENDKVVVRQVNSQFEYTYEYQVGWVRD